MTFPLTLLFIFLVFLRPQEWLFPWMYGWPVLDVVTYGTCLSLALSTGKSKTDWPRTPAVMLAVGLWFAAVFSHVVHGYFQGMMDTIPLTFKLCFFMVLLLVVTNSTAHLRGIMLARVLGASVMAIHAIMQDRTGAGFAGATPYITGRTDGQVVAQSRFFGNFADPNDLGQFLVTCMPLAFAIPKRLWVGTLVAVAGIVWLLSEAMLTTHSRGTLIAVIATVACMIFIRLPAKLLPYLAVLALGAGLLACVQFGGMMMDESAHDRLVFWGYANRYFKHHLLFGGGFGMFGEITGTDRAAHNAYVLCYTEIGLVGYWFWFNLLTLGLIGCWRTRVAFRKPRTPEQVYLKRAAGLCMASVVGYAVSSYFLSRAFMYPLFFLFSMLASIPIIAMKHLPDDHPSLIDFRKDVLLTGTVSCLVSVAYIYSTIVLLNMNN